MLCRRLSNRAKEFLLDAFHPKISIPVLAPNDELILHPARFPAVHSAPHSEAIRAAITEIHQLGLTKLTEYGDYELTIEGHQAIIQLLQSQNPSV